MRERVPRYKKSRKIIGKKKRPTLTRKAIEGSLVTKEIVFEGRNRNRESPKSSEVRKYKKFPSN
jgi:hypothetical protein